MRFEINQQKRLQGQTEKRLADSDFLPKKTQQKTLMRDRNYKVRICPPKSMLRKFLCGSIGNFRGLDEGATVANSVRIQ